MENLLPCYASDSDTSSTPNTPKYQTEPSLDSSGFNSVFETRTSENSLQTPLIIPKPQTINSPSKVSSPVKSETLEDFERELEECVQFEIDDFTDLTDEFNQIKLLLHNKLFLHPKNSVLVEPLHEVDVDMQAIIYSS
jgi:hypothetical protein